MSGPGRGAGLVPDRVVALGGGHGLAASLAALRHVTSDLTAVVTVADNGGSSGRLRREFGVLPPGDLRMALAALCGDDHWGETWARVLQHRFDSRSDLDGHSLGNLLILTLWELLQDEVDGLDLVARLLGAHGRVLPMVLSPLDITAQVSGLDADDPAALSFVRGQVEVATTAGHVESVALVPEDPRPCPETLAAIQGADWVVLGPGSWYSSVLPHLLLPAMREALSMTRGRIVVTMNLAPQAGETDGFSIIDHLDVLTEHAPDLPLHAVLVERASVGDLADLERAVALRGARLEVADLHSEDAPETHDPAKLASAYARLFAR